MAWVKKRPRGNAKRYKRFSSVQVKTKSSGPTTFAVFPGGRTIPDSALPGFAYRHRGTSLAYTEEEIIEKLRQHKQALAFFGLIPDHVNRIEEDAFWAQLAVKWAQEVKADPRLKVEMRADQMRLPHEFPPLEYIEQLTVLWQSEFRQRIHYWNSISLPIIDRKPQPGDFLRMYFQAREFIFLEKDGFVYRRSNKYTDHDLAMGAYHSRQILWSSASPSVPPCPDG